MRDETTHIVAAIVLTTVFWLLFMFFSTPGKLDEVDAYRHGYAECKAGMDSRYDPRKSLAVRIEQP